MPEYEIEHNGVIAETDLAKLFEVVEEDLIDAEVCQEGLWIPKSAITYEDDDTVLVKEWWADKKGFG